MSCIERRCAISLPMPAARAFPLFTPLGERDWIADWDPVFIHPRDGQTCEGMAFETSHNGAHAIWTCTRWSPDRHSVEYVRVAGGSHVGVITVECAEPAVGSTEVSVAYRLTALSEAGEAYLAGMSEPAFRTMISGWRDLLAARYGFH